MTLTAEPDEADALDAYSQVVTSVAARLLASVAQLRVQDRRRGGTGSAVTISGDGLLITSAHVVDGARTGTAAFADGRETDVEVIGTDRLSDLAVLRAAAGDLPAAALGDASTLHVGQLVVAVGSPLGFAGSISAGVVSALGRSLPTRDGRHLRIVDDVIQTDAALHPGNSGGALATSHGEVVGINTAVVGPGIGQGLGLAVPINASTTRVIQTLISEGRVRRAYLGLGGGTRPLPPRAVEAAGRTRGLEITSVVGGGPAAAAGLRPEDIVIAVDGVAVEGIADLQRALTPDRIGTPMVITVVRAGSLRSLEVVPIELA
jgi:S1-C subfamily serine protease